MRKYFWVLLLFFIIGIVRESHGWSTKANELVPTTSGASSYYLKYDSTNTAWTSNIPIIMSGTTSSIAFYNNYANIAWYSAGARDYLGIGVDLNNALYSGYVVIGERADLATYVPAAVVTNPTLRILGATPTSYLEATCDTITTNNGITFRGTNGFYDFGDADIAAGFEIKIDQTYNQSAISSRYDDLMLGNYANFTHASFPNLSYGTSTYPKLRFLSKYVAVGTSGNTMWGTIGHDNDTLNVITGKGNITFNPGNSANSAVASVTTLGGYAIRLKNSESTTIVAGTIVVASDSENDGIKVAGANSTQPLGVVFSDIAAGEYGPVTIQGKCLVLLKDTTAATRGQWVRVSDTVGRADVMAYDAGTVTQSLGNCISSVIAGTNKKALIVVNPR